VTALEPRIKAHAYGLGFDLCGIATLGPASTARHFDRWLERGFAGEMYYLKRWADRRRDSRLPARGMRSAVVVALDYGGAQPRGAIARYARGRDYHAVMHGKLAELRRAIRAAAGRPVRMRAYSDTAPILERDLARRAGVGWFGKNTMLIHPKLGSCFVIGSVLTDLPLAADAPFESEHCGTCSRCLDACPTRAFPEPHVLDATRCISYQTIEQRGAIPEALRSAIGERAFGCDVCQDVCPWNERFARVPAADGALAPRAAEIAPDLAGLLALDDAGFAARFGDSAVARAGRRGLARNAAVALGNRRAPGDRAALERARDGDPEPLVREHAAWALRQFPEGAGRPVPLGRPL
jgi:epoxyqueuosine reductase